MKHPAPTRQPREPLTLDLIEAALLHLMEAGKTPSEPNVRELLGGSPNTIHPLIGRWFATRAPLLLEGRISIVQGDELPGAVRDLIAELRAEAREAAEAALSDRVATAEALAEEARLAGEKAAQREAEALAQARNLEAVVPTLRAELDLARAEVAAVRTHAEALAAERREALATAEAAQRMLEAEQRAAERTASALSAANDTIASLQADLEEADESIESSRQAMTAQRALMERSAADFAAAMAAMQGSIEEIRAAHLREIQSLRATQTEAAGRWADARTALESRVRVLEVEIAGFEVEIAAKDEALGRLNTEAEVLRETARQATLKQQAAEKDRDALRDRLLAEDGIAKLIKRIDNLEAEKERDALRSRLGLKAENERGNEHE